MRRGRVFLYLSLILILLVAGGYLLYTNFLRPSTGPSDAPAEVAIPDRVDIVVITQKAPRGTVLDETVLGLIPLPRDLLISGMFTDLAQVVGRQAKFDLDSGIPLTNNMLVDSASQLSDAGSVASLSIPEGMVAKSIPMNRLASVAYALRPGDRVVVIASMQFIDIDSEFQTVLPNTTALFVGGSIGIGGDSDKPTGLAGYALLPEESAISVAGRVDNLDGGEQLQADVYMIPSENQRPRLAAQIIIPSATVLHVGDFDFEEEGVDLTEEVPAAPPAEGEVAPVPEENPPDNITLIVTPQEAVNLTYLIDSGVKISLALRSAGDATVIDTETATIQYFLDDYSIPLPGKLPYGLVDRVDQVKDADDVVEQPAATP